MVVEDNGKLVPKVMRWGFPHPKHREVNNTRSDSLHNSFWKESLSERRRLVPIQEFYEWEELPPNAPKGMTKGCYSFKRPDIQFLWVAGIWQEFPDLVGNVIDNQPLSRAAGVSDPRPTACQPALGPLSRLSGWRTDRLVTGWWGPHCPSRAESAQTTVEGSRKAA